MFKLRINDYLYNSQTNSNLNRGDIMEKRLYFYIPAIEELTYRQKIMSQPDTMDYNKGYDVSFEGYHKDTGCIDFPKNKWTEWHSYMVNNKPKCFYAYITRKEDNTFIGEVNIHWNNDKKWYEMGIVLESKYRGMRYSLEALKNLLRVAFDEYNAPAVHNDFEIIREAAIALHKAAGFNIINEANGIVELLITREDYLNN